VHRGLGVHISFVRSITMDAFKAAEIERMRLGGNKTWKEFFEAADENKMAGITWDDATIAERYSGDVGDEYKERLTAKVEGREYVKSATAPKPKPAAAPTSQTGSAVGSRSQTPSGLGRNGRTASPGGQSLAEARKAKVDDKYFSKLGAENASRPADLPPSQGGKYAGFGSAPADPVKESGALPGFEDLQKDPVAALTKGFGWFTTTVGKTAKTVNDSYIQPTAQRVCFPPLA
jgi:ADP-ribosylation factor GTPase-activating protein 1